MLNCSYCANFGRVKIKQKCPDCGRCAEHRACICRTCTFCSKRTHDYCPACLKCNSHHLNNYSRKFQHRSCEILDPKQPKSTFIINTLQRSIGVELEIGELEGADGNPQLRQLGRWDHDASVLPSKMEWDSNPMRGDNYLENITKAVDVFHTYKCKVNETCGFHVHVDGADLGARELRRILVGFFAIQDGLYGTLIHPNRKKPSPNGNHYCAPLKLSAQTIERVMSFTTHREIMQWFYTYLYKMDHPMAPSLGSEANYKRAVMEYNRQLSEAKRQKYMNDARRQSLNFHSWMMRGTLEFRHKEGTLDAAEILNWPLWCGWFIEHTASLSDEVVMQWVKSPPNVLELTKSWYNGRSRPLSNLITWVEGHVANPMLASAAQKVPSVEANLRPAGAGVNHVVVNMNQRLRGVLRDVDDAALVMRQEQARAVMAQARHLQAQVQGYADGAMMQQQPPPPLEPPLMYERVEWLYDPLEHGLEEEPEPNF